jgi:hypothetical protein
VSIQQRRRTRPSAPEGGPTKIRRRGARRTRAIRRLAQITVLAILLAISAMALQTSAALAAKSEVLVVSRQSLADAAPTLISGLETLGRSVAETEEVPADLTAYKAVWVLNVGISLFSAEEAALENYVKAGGRLYLTGENDCCEEINRSDQNIARAVLKDEAVTVGGYKKLNGAGQFNPLAKDAVTRSPHELSHFLAVAPGQISSVDTLGEGHALAYSEEAATGAVFDETDMKSGHGRLAIYMDINYLSPKSTEEAGMQVSERERLEVIENLEDFLENTSQRDELPGDKPPAGNVLVLTSQAPTNLKAGLDTAAELRGHGYHVTLNVAPSITLARRRPSVQQKLTPWKMPKLKHYSAVWMLAEGSPAAQGASREALERYVAKGGRLYLGGDHVTWPSNEADRDLLRYLVRNENISIHDSISEGAMQFAPDALDAITQEPSQLHEMPIHNTAEISGLAQRNVLATSGEEATAAAFDEADMYSQRGRLVIYPDDWTQATQGPSTEGAAFVQNIQDFLEATPQRIAPRAQEYVALGDSYAAGVGSFEYEPGTTGENGCYRALHGFVKQIAEAHHLSLAFEACKGAQIGDIWEGAHGYLPQIDGVGPDTHAITLTIGGNDVGFAGVIKTCLLPKFRFKLIGKGTEKFFEGCHRSLEAASQEALGWLRYGRAAGKYKRPGGDNSGNAQYQPSLQQLYESILYQAPGAELVVNGYPLLLESDRDGEDYSSCSVAPPAPLKIRGSDLPWMTETGEQLNEVIKEAVEATRASTGRQIRFADPRSVFKGHALCDSANSWINGVEFDPQSPIPHGKLEIAQLLNTKVESFHPTVEGQNALFNLIEDTAHEF